MVNIYIYIYIYIFFFLSLSLSRYVIWFHDIHDIVRHSHGKMMTSWKWVELGRKDTGRLDPENGRLIHRQTLQVTRKINVEAAKITLSEVLVLNCSSGKSKSWTPGNVLGWVWHTWENVRSILGGYSTFAPHFFYTFSISNFNKPAKNWKKWAGLHLLRSNR